MPAPYWRPHNIAAKNGSGSAIDSSSETSVPFEPSSTDPTAQKNEAMLAPESRIQTKPMPVDPPAAHGYAVPPPPT